MSPPPHCGCGSVFHLASICLILIHAGPNQDWSCRCLATALTGCCDRSSPFRSFPVSINAQQRRIGDGTTRPDSPLLESIEMNKQDKEFKSISRAAFADPANVFDRMNDRMEWSTAMSPEVEQ